VSPKVAEILFERPGGEMAMISIDATVEETHGSSALITEHAVEVGSNVTDHIRPENDKLSLLFMISNTPINVPGSHMDGATGDIQPLNIFLQQAPRRADGNPIQVTPFVPGRFIAFGARIPPTPERPIFEPQPLLPGDIAGEDGVSVLQFSQEFDRVRAVYDELRGIIGTGTLVTIITSLRSYENMALANLTTPRDAEHGNAVEFAADAVQVKIVSTETVAAPDPVESRADPSGGRGGQGTEDTDEAEGTRSSLWHNLFFG